MRRRRRGRWLPGQGGGPESLVKFFCAGDDRPSARASSWPSRRALRTRDRRHRRASRKLSAQPCTVDAAGGKLLSMARLLRWHSPQLGSEDKAGALHSHRRGDAAWHPLDRRLKIHLTRPTARWRAGARNRRWWSDAVFDRQRVGHTSCAKARSSSASPEGDRTSAGAGARIAPEQLELEITEAIADGQRRARYRFRPSAPIRTMGVRLSLDDFGTRPIQPQLSTPLHQHLDRPEDQPKPSCTTCRLSHADRPAASSRPSCRAGHRKLLPPHRGRPAGRHPTLQAWERCPKGSGKRLGRRLEERYCGIGCDETAGLCTARAPWRGPGCLDWAAMHARPPRLSSDGSVRGRRATIQVEVEVSGGRNPK